MKATTKIVTKKAAVSVPVAGPAATPTKTTAAAKKVPLRMVSPKAIPKPKLVRDSFTIPKDEYLVLSDLKARMNQLMQPAKKSELLRAGLKVLAAMSDTAIKKALQAVPSIKTGRPSDSKK
jgi:hypothetical protein